MNGDLRCCDVYISWVCNICKGSLPPPSPKICYVVSQCIICCECIKEMFILISYYGIVLKKKGIIPYNVKKWNILDGF